MSLYKITTEHLTKDPMNDSKFEYIKEKWEDLDAASKELVKTFQGIEICRQDVVDAYKEYYQNNGDHLKPFLMTMIWGFGTVGYGNFRTNKYLNESGNKERIKLALQAVQDDKREVAFNTLKEIRGLNVSYISKVLYFAERSLDKDNYALIFDIRVARSLVRLNSSKEIASMVSVMPSTSFKAYTSYIDMVHKRAGELNVDADKIEMYLFELSGKK